MNYKILQQWGIENPDTKSSLRMIYVYAISENKCYYCLGYYNDSLTAEENQTRIINGFKIRDTEAKGVLDILLDMISKHTSKVKFK